MAWFLPRVFAPSVEVIALTVFVIVATSATLLMIAQIAGAGISELPVVSDALGWCRALYGGDHGAPPVLGVVALIVLCGVLTGMARAVFRRHRHLRSFGEIDGIHVIASAVPVAFAVPGRRGGVVMSDSLLSQLSRSERSVVLAHENAHLRHRHHLYLTLVDTCAAGLPFLRPFARRVNYLTERWADEVAAERIGSREIVAETIARVALLPSIDSRVAVLSIGGGNVVRRFEALTATAPEPNSGITISACCLVTVSIFGVLLQLHHWMEFVTHAGHL